MTPFTMHVRFTMAALRKRESQRLGGSWIPLNNIVLERFKVIIIVIVLAIVGDVILYTPGPVPGYD